MRTESKPILCLDFDGVIHSYSSGWQGPLTIADDPVPGALEFIRDAQRAFIVDIYSTRSNTLMGRAKMMGWMHNRLVEAFGEVEGERIANRIGFPSAKPPAFLTLDDRALTFTGVWPKVDELISFKPWNKS